MAYGVLLSGVEETDITDYFITTAFPTRQEAEQVLSALRAAAEGLSIPELLARVNVSRDRVAKTLELLSLESPAPLVQQGSKWLLTPARLGEGFWKRADRLTTMRRQEQQQMQDYVNLASGHMEFLVRALDGDPSRVWPATAPPLPATADPDLVRQATEFLDRSSLVIPPRALWPAGGLPHLGLRGRIEPDRQARPGRALCRWGDSGWGESVRRGKYVQGRYSDELVTACTEMVRTWDPGPTPTWVTCIPSRRHPGLVPDFARRLADSLGLPFHGVLDKTDERPPQKDMANNSQQARNVDGSLAVNARTLPRGPALLVDDMVDSGWTLTIAAWLLRSRGAGDVFPVVLANTGHRR